jgi:hypothetical protein
VWIALYVTRKLLLSNDTTDRACLLPNFQFNAFEHIDQPNVEAMWEPKTNKDCLFKNLKVVDITHGQAPLLSLQSTKSMLQFGKFVLSTAPVLEKINFIKLENGMVIFEMLKWFPKLSMMAEIVFVP